MNVDLDAAAAIRAKTYRFEDLLTELIHLADEIGEDADEMPFPTHVSSRMHEMVRDLERLKGKVCTEGDYLEEKAKERAARPKSATMRIIDDEMEGSSPPTAHDLALLLHAIEGGVDLGTREEIQDAVVYLISQHPELAENLRRLAERAKEVPGNVLRNGTIPPDRLRRTAMSDPEAGQ